MPLEGRAFFVTRLPAYACYMLISIIQASLKISINTSQAHLLTNTHFPVVMRLRDTPVPIPNTMVKT